MDVRTYLSERSPFEIVFCSGRRIAPFYARAVAAQHFQKVPVGMRTESSICRESRRYGEKNLLFSDSYATKG